MHDSIDDKLREALGTELPDATRVQAAVRRKIHGRPWFKITAIAAALLVGVWLSTASLRMSAIAALDHNIEVVKGQKRRWRTDRDDISKLVARYGLTFDHAAALAPAPYVLERAKICANSGHRMLHLVYSGAAKKYSIFLEELPASGAAVQVVQLGSEQVGRFQTERYSALVVTSDLDCGELSRYSSSKL